MTLRELPVDDVTFLFTDIERSTRLLRAAGPNAYADLQARHRKLLREAVSLHEGVEVDTQGDGSFFAFPDAAGAVHAAVDGREMLAAHEWPEGREVRVRMGLHRGTPLVTDEGYVGEDVHRAARIAALGAGGQILLSQPLGDLLVHDQKIRDSLIDLGLHRLKDFNAPNAFIR